MNNACHICGSQELGRLPFVYRFRGRWIRGIRCSRCGVIFLDPQPSPEEIRSLYAKDYFDGDYRCGHAGSCFTEATADALLDRHLLDRIRAERASGRFLEVGCAGGTFLSAARDTGYDVCGVEISPDAADVAIKRFGLDVRIGDLAAARFPAQSFDVVFMGDVIEHLHNPVATLKELHRIMTPGGILVLACPTQTNTLFSRLGFAVYGMLGKTVSVSLPPYHLFEYRPKSMRRLLQGTGFALRRLHGGLIPPSSIALRGSWMHRTGKKLLQYPNVILTRVFGIWGDRLEVIAAKIG